MGHVTGEDLIHQAERSKERSEEAEICYVFNLRVQLQPFGFTVIGLPTLPTTLTLRSLFKPFQSSGGQSAKFAVAQWSMPEDRFPVFRSIYKTKCICTSVPCSTADTHAHLLTTFASLLLPPAYVCEHLHSSKIVDMYMAVHGRVAI